MPLPIYQAKSKPAVPQFQVIAIAAGKGGVGKSTVTVNLALALAKHGYRVGILDADLYGPSVRKMLPEMTPPFQQGEWLIPATCIDGIKMLSMAYFRPEKEAAAIRAPIANNIILQFLQKTQWGNIDYLLLDFPPGTGDIQLTLSQRAHLLGAVMVTTPQQVALLDVRKAISLFNQVKVPILGIIENMSYYLVGNDKHYLFGQGGGAQLALDQGLPFFGEIPIDPEISRLGDLGKPLIPARGSALTMGGQAFINLADALVHEAKFLKEHSEGIIQDFQIKWKEMPNETFSN